MDFHCKAVAHGDRFTLKTGPDLHPGKFSYWQTLNSA
jgi:hypothetical protein